MTQRVENVQILEIAVRCRLCAEYSSELLPILEDVPLTAKIEHLFHIKVLPGDPYVYICTTCSEVVLSTWEYSERVHKAQEILLEAELAVECTNSSSLQDITTADFVTDCQIPVAVPLDSGTNQDSLGETSEGVQDDIIDEDELEDEEEEDEHEEVELQEKRSSNRIRSSRNNKVFIT